MGIEFVDTRQERGYDRIHFIKDHFGYIDEALRKIYAKLKQELYNIQKEIEEF